MSRSIGYTASMSLFIVLVLLTASGFLGMRPPRVAVAEAPQAKRESFVVVELFTSEGCSSCPPADVLLRELAKRQAAGEAIYLLGYHVDYWNRLGWKDPFTLAGATQRQSRYADRLGLDQIYTPQAIVNGTTEFVGSNRGKLTAAVSDALAGSPTQTLTLATKTKTDPKAGEMITIEYSYEGVSGPETSDQLLLALVQRSGESKVSRGENAGRTLKHTAIVRQLVTLPLKNSAAGTATIDLPQKLDPRELELVGFVQNGETGRITAAAKTDLFQPVK
jgi:hypothetical protein